MKQTSTTGARSLRLALVVFTLLAPTALAEDGGLDARVASTAGTDAGVDASVPLSADPKTAQIRALMAGTLAVTVRPSDLFDVTLTDEVAVQVASVRTRAFLRTVDEAPETASSGSRARRPTPAATAAADTLADIETVDAGRWAARVGLDRARLEFYSLTPERRGELLRTHASRQEAARPRETEEARQARLAEAERASALAAAHAARSEAERLVSQELARLIGLERRVVQAREGFRTERDALIARRDLVLGWHRRVASAKGATARASDADADAMYDAVRRTLLASRDEFDVVLDSLGSSQSVVPDVGVDRLAEVPADISTDAVRARLRRVERSVRAGRAEERALLAERASTLHDEINALNRERLGLLGSLSPAKRRAITGFTVAGLDQAKAEARQLTLVLRYHRYVAASWVRSIRTNSGVQQASSFSVAAVAVPWLIVAIMFSVWRRRSRPLLLAINERMAANDRAERRTRPSPSRRVYLFFLSVRRPLEWLAFFATCSSLLPTDAHDLLEVQLFGGAVGWTLGASFIVNAINSIAATSDTPAGHLDDAVDQLRLRSLRLVGRVVVAFALVLFLSQELVGKGTVYSWASSTSWFAAVPIFIVIVMWWRQTVFDRVDRVRRKSRVRAWIVENRTGWKSFAAATVAAVLLFSLGSVKTARSWVGGFDLTRRAHAYLFKRELDRLGDGSAGQETRAIAASASASLAPDRQGSTWLPCPADQHIKSLVERTKCRRGGVVVVVGPRGQGKTAFLGRLADEIGYATRITCTAEMSEGTIREALAADTGPRSSDNPLRLVVLDDARALVRPVVRGLVHFDSIFAFARQQSADTLFVFAVDSAVWPFLRRARDARPLFDEVLTLDPWTDDQIGELLSSRCAEAGIAPTFEDLLDNLPPSADELDKLDALEAKRVGYVRMIWDYARGNPGIALEVWRSSLGEADDGSIRVRPLQAPDAARLESLPDSALFVLRAVLQLAPATVADVASLTRLNEVQIENAFRYGQAHGYLVESDGSVRVSWPWVRPVTLFLQRRHLVVNS